MYSRQITYLKVKIKSLAEEAKIIRLEERKAKKYGNKLLREGLRSHRIWDVRREARASLLAYAFLRGKSYHSIEQTVKNKPDWDRVVKIIKKFGGQIFSLTTKDTFNAWKEEKEYAKER